jgi:LEA14-like dessication related protein
MKCAFEQIFQGSRQTASKAFVNSILSPGLRGPSNRRSLALRWFMIRFQLVAIGLCLSLGGLALGGCAVLKTNLQEPQVQLQQVDLGEAGLTDATLIFNFRVQNPNAVALTVDQVDYRFQLNDKPLTKGLINQGLKVGAHSSVTIPVPIRVNYTDLTNSLSDLFKQGSSPYRLDGTVKVGLLSIPFQKTGELNLAELQKK